MYTIRIQEAVIQFSTLLEKVDQGEQVTITQNGEPFALLVPITPKRHDHIARTVEKMKEFQEKHSLDGLSIREMINEGHR